jgi:hypothetical protein
MNELSTLEMLKQLSEKYGPTATAKMIGVSHVSLWRWVNGKQKMARMADAHVRLLWQNLSETWTKN